MHITQYLLTVFVLSLDWALIVVDEQVETCSNLEKIVMHYALF